MKTFKFLTKNPPKHFNSGIIYDYETAVQLRDKIAKLKGA